MAAGMIDWARWSSPLLLPLGGPTMVNAYVCLDCGHVLPMDLTAVNVFVAHPRNEWVPIAVLHQEWHDRLTDVMLNPLLSVKMSAEANVEPTHSVSAVPAKRTRAKGGPA